MQFKQTVKIGIKIMNKIFLPGGPKKVCDRVCSLNKLIIFFGDIIFSSIHTDNSFLANMFLKWIEKKL